MQRSLANNSYLTNKYVNDGAMHSLQGRTRSTPTFQRRLCLFLTRPSCTTGSDTKLGCRLRVPGHPSESGPRHEAATTAFVERPH